MSHVKLNDAFLSFSQKTEIPSSLYNFPYTLSLQCHATTAVARKKIHADYFWNVGGS
jgi:hypothetical protein